jgi:hypothetical protein
MPRQLPSIYVAFIVLGGESAVKTGYPYFSKVSSSSLLAGQRRANGREGDLRSQREPSATHQGHAPGVR